MSKPVILDCDPGHDDAVAIMLSGLHPAIDLLGITVSSGNQTLDKTTKNALNLVQYLSLDVPVYKGVKEPLVAPLRIADDIHGESGLDGVTFERLTHSLQDKHAVDFIIDTLRNHEEPVTLAITGPMTNVALALKMAPDIASNIEEVVFMGGAHGYGNVTPAAEFNILVDPEAAQIVLNQPFKKTMVGLDVTRQALVTPEVVQTMDALKTQASKLFVDLMKVYNENQQQIFGLVGGPMHDPITIAYLIDPSIVTTDYAHCSIDLSHGESYGRTNCDLFNYQHKEKNTYVAHKINVTAFWQLVRKVLAGAQ